MEQIAINQNDNQEINILSIEPQFITLSNNEIQDININLIDNQDLNINELENQIIYVEGNGNIIGISDVLVNGVSVVSDNIAYVLVPTKTSDLINDSGYITKESDPTVPYYIKQITIADINSWNNKQDELVSGSNIKTINNESLLGSGNINIGGTDYTAGYGINIDSEDVISNSITSYNDLTDLPTIPTQTSELINDSNYVTSNELSEVAFSGSFTDLSNAPDIPTDTSDLNNDSGFISESDYASNLHGGTIKVGVNSYDINSIGQLYADTQTYVDYVSLANTNFIGKGTLENVFTGKGFIDNTVNNLTNYTLSSSLSSVATSGNYTDLINTPTIPSISDSYGTSTTNGYSQSYINTQLGNKQDTITDSGWLDLTLENGITSRDNTAKYKAQYRKIGNIVYLKGQVSIPAHSSLIVMATIPSGYRPYFEGKLPILVTSNWIDTDGKIYISADNTARNNQNIQTWWTID